MKQVCANARQIQWHAEMGMFAFQETAPAVMLKRAMEMLQPLSATRKITSANVPRAMMHV